MRTRAIACSAVLAALCACSSGPAAPTGWHPLPGASAQWTNAGGNQHYSVTKRAFSGTLQDLASQEAVNVVLREHGAKFLKSNVFTPCPGMAAIAYFTLGPSQLLEEGFAVQGDQAVLARYTRPVGAAPDPAVSTAMERALCVVR